MLSIRFLQLLPGEAVFTQGEVANSVFCISSGRVKIDITHRGRRRTIAYLHSGEFFGEHCLSEYPYRPNTAITLGKTTLMEFDKHDLLHALEGQPKLREMFIRNLIDHKVALEKTLSQISNIDFTWHISDLEHEGR
jgi:CRP-like cAMP-binding protein